MTYLPATCKRWELLAGWWRCQGKTLEEQIANGIRWFDLRLTWCAGRWHWAHGYVDLGEADVLNVIDAIGECGGHCRLMLERGGSDAVDAFTKAFCDSQFIITYPQVTAVVIKEGWKALWYGRNYLPMTDCSWVPYHRNRPWWQQIKSIVKFPFSTIRVWARRHKRPQQREREDATWIWVYDWV